MSDLSYAHYCPCHYPCFPSLNLVCIFFLLFPLPSPMLYYLHCPTSMSYAFCPIRVLLRFFPLTLTLNLQMLFFPFHSIPHSLQNLEPDALMYPPGDEPESTFKTYVDVYKVRICYSIMPWHDMAWYDVIWHDMTWRVVTIMWYNCL